MDIQRNKNESSSSRFEFTPKGPFDLSNQVSYFGDWISASADPEAIIMAFPVEGWQGSCAVRLKQNNNGMLEGQVFGPSVLHTQAREQALAALSLDIDGEKWPQVGKRDKVIHRLQEKYNNLRPVLFHSPYEAAAAFIIGHRISIKQRISVMRRMSQEFGERIEIAGQFVDAFPLPDPLLSLKQYSGLNETKVMRLNAVAGSTMEGLLDRHRLRSMNIDEALTKLQELPGIGPFFAQGILHRGAGLVDAITFDDVSRYAVQNAYHLAQPPDRDTMLKIAEPWQPFRMWAIVLLHVWLHREVGLTGPRTLKK